jgi:secondary thiamine-phosphate synthase enzyme
MRQEQTVLTVPTRGHDTAEITDEIRRWVRESGVRTGLLTVFCQHTSASLMIMENADPSVLHDIRTWLGHMAPEDKAGHGRYRHDTEGADDMPAHIRSLLTGVSLAIPVGDGGPLLGTWQGVFVCEHRARGHGRKIVLHLIGD